MNTPTTPPADTPVDTRSIACMEVWGGHAAFEGRVSAPGNDVSISCTPFAAGNHGGDLYYVSNCAAGLITRFVLADVSGHGEEVADVALSLRKLMRRHINTANQARFAVSLNRAFGRLELGGRFATALLLTYFAPTDHLIVCNAGHPRPMLYRAATRQWSSLDSATPGAISTTQKGAGSTGIANLPLGVLDPTHYEQLAIQIFPGDLVIIYTDALIEATDRAGRQLGEAGLLELIRAIPAHEHADMADLCRRQVLEWSGRPSLNDDATIVALHHNAIDPPRQSWSDRAAAVARMLGIGDVYSAPIH